MSSSRLVFLRVSLVALVLVSGAVSFAAEKPRLDVNGDPLPKGAVARLGTPRLRHSEGVYVARFSEDGQTLVSFGKDDTFRTWDARTGQQISSQMRTGFHPEWFASVAFSPDGKTLAIGCGARWPKDDENRVLVCDVATGQDRHELLVPKAGWNIPSVAFSPNAKLLAAGDSNGRLHLWESGTGKLLRVARGNANVAQGLTFLPDGQGIVSTSSKPEMLTLWSVPELGEVRSVQRGGSWRQQTEPCARPGINSNGKLLATGDSDLAIRIWDLASGKQICKFPGPGAEDPPYFDFRDITGLHFCPNANLLAVATCEGGVRLLDATTGKLVRRLNGDGSPRQDGRQSPVAFSPDGKTVATWHGEASIHLWNVSDGKEVSLAAGHSEAVNAVAFSPDSQTVVTAGEDGFVRIWDSRTGRAIRGSRPLDGSSGVAGVAFAPDGKRVACTGRHLPVGLLDVSSGKCVPAPDSQDLIFWARDGASVAFFPDGRIVAAGRGAIGILDPKQGRPTVKLRSQLEFEASASLALSADGSLLVSGGVAWNRTRDGLGRPRGKFQEMPFISLWDPAAGTLLASLQVPDAAVRNVALSPDGRRLASVSDDGKLRVWEVATSQERGCLEGRNCVAISPDGCLLASAGKGNEVKVWDLATCRERCVLRGHEGPVKAVAFSPDGKLLASASADTTALLWDLTAFPPPAPVKAKAKPAELWDDLGSSDAGFAGEAIGALLSQPDVAVKLIREQLPPADASKARLEQLIADLDADSFSVRQKASGELEKLGTAAVPTLGRALEGDPSLEKRSRIVAVLEASRFTVQSCECRQAIRAVEVLERIGTRDARELLKQLAGGVVGARLTHEARAALKRLQSSASLR